MFDRWYGQTTTSRNVQESVTDSTGLAGLDTDCGQVTSKMVAGFGLAGQCQWPGLGHNMVPGSDHGHSYQIIIRFP